MKRAINVPAKIWAIGFLFFFLSDPGPVGGMERSKKWDLAQVVSSLQNRLKQVRGLSLEVEYRPASGERSIYRIMALRPNYYRVEGEHQSFYCDGASAWLYVPERALYSPLSKYDRGMLIPYAAGFSGYNPPPRERPEFVGIEETVLEKKRVLALREKEDETGFRISVFVDPETWLPVGHEQKQLEKSDLFLYRRVRTDRRFVPADFAWSPPPGAVNRHRIGGAKLLPAGGTAPDVEFTLTDGSRLSLDRALRGKKGLLLCFWWINCGYCRLEMHELEALHRTVKDLGIVAVNDAEPPGEIRRFVRKANYGFPVAIDEGRRIAEAYKVKPWGRPVSYLIRPDRTIACVQVGFGAEKKFESMQKELGRLGVAISHTFRFRLERSELGRSELKLPLIEGTLHFGKEPMPSLKGIPTMWREVEHAGIRVDPGSEGVLNLIRGIDPDGHSWYCLDRDGDGDFSGEKPVAFAPEGNVRTARIPFRLKTAGNRRDPCAESVIALRETGSSRLEFHLDEVWRAELRVGKENLAAAIQRFPPEHPCVFLDADRSENFATPFFPEREVLALGGLFFKMSVNFPESELILTETKQQPVNEGFPAPAFEAELWPSGETFNLESQRGKIVVVTFWSPLCSGSRSEVPAYNGLAREFASDPNVLFLAVSDNEKALGDFLRQRPHRFRQIVSADLQARFGVAVPFVTLVIDQNGVICRRFFCFSPEIRSLIRELAGSRDARSVSR